MDVDWLMVWVICMVLSLLIGGIKGQAFAGLICGFLFGPLGVLIAIFSRSKKPKSPVKKTE